MRELSFKDNSRIKCSTLQFYNIHQPEYEFQLKKITLTLNVKSTHNILLESVFFISLSQSPSRYRPLLFHSCKTYFAFVKMCILITGNNFFFWKGHLTISEILVKFIHNFTQSMEYLWYDRVINSKFIFVVNSMPTLNPVSNIYSTYTFIYS